LPDGFADRISRIVGPKGLVHPGEGVPFLTEWRKRWHGRAGLIVQPGSAEDLASVVGACAAHRVAMVPQGGNTGLVGGQIPMNGEVLISTRRLRTIYEVDAAGNTMLVDAGVTLAEAQAAAKKAGRFFPVSIGAEGTCQIGGIISTNAGGVNVLRYGNTREQILGLEAILPSGEIWNGLNRLRKNNTGYDIKQLFIGGEGTLGIVTKAVLKLYPPAEVKTTMVAGLRDLDQVIAFLGAVQAGSGGLVSSFEFMARPCIDLCLKHIPESRDPFPDVYPFYVLIELSASGDLNLPGMGETLLGRAIENGLVADAVIAQNESQAQDFWHMRHSISEALNGEGKGVRHDVSVPIAAMPSFLRDANAAVERVAPRARPVAFGHVGDGNVHYDILPPEGAHGDALDPAIETIEQAVFDVVDRYQGSISAEHGIGQAKRITLAGRKSPVEMEMMRSIKAALDPHGLMNPGKVL